MTPTIHFLASAQSFSLHLHYIPNSSPTFTPPFCYAKQTTTLLNQSIHHFPNLINSTVSPFLEPISSITFYSCNQRIQPQDFPSPFSSNNRNPHRSHPNRISFLPPTPISSFNKQHNQK
ncbi:hypothetical protein V8G54_025088 [Vigna mungo]|uniref:Uncharacterized protein n=1 Tax=Vigna mungo TaxID=3915 RepID=A0AAQ3N828_VIGMU